MLLKIRTTHNPATELGYLLHKHPERAQRFELKFGDAHVFYTQAEEHACEAVLLLDVDPVSLVRGRRDSEASGPLTRYVNDRPYAASSFLSVAIAQVFGSALNGTCKSHPELAASAIPLEVELANVALRGGPRFATPLFEALGYDVELELATAGEEQRVASAIQYATLRLRGTQRLQDALSHLYVLIPVLDDDKHYFISSDEVAKLLKHGGAWLAAHPMRDAITYRYLKRQRSLAREALERLDADAGEEQRQTPGGEAALERPLRLNDQRMLAVHQALRELGASTVLDLGCGEGKLISRLLRDRRFGRVVGVDTSILCLERAHARLHLDDMAPKMRERVELWHGSLTYRDARFEGFDAATLVEVVEHVDASRLRALERVVFEFARPAAVVLTTPNREYNALFDKLVNGALRHDDHRFEWTREDFASWVEGVSTSYGYAAEFGSIGEEHAELGAPTQMVTLRRKSLS